MAIPLVRDDSGAEKVNLMELTKRRLDEIEKLHQSMKASQYSGLKRVFQTLPKHLRRRAASHQPNRVPTRHRTKSFVEHEKMKANEEKDSSSKKKKQRFGNRKRNKKPLMAERLHKTTPDKAAWLETHYWHAKRFHMQDIWGYRLVRKTE